ncbi:MAG: glycosyltransferase family 4 protein, partial [Planctomycetes bacterium]|nr:glycosyltransferase family 4 protein [Planctomycetota bacterium]
TPGWTTRPAAPAPACAAAPAPAQAPASAPPCGGPPAASLAAPRARCCTSGINRTRLLLVIDSLEVGGAERQFLELVRRLDRTRYDVRVCLTVGRGRLFDRLTPLCDEVTVFEKRHRADPLPLLRLIGLLRRRPVDVLHSFLYYSNALCKLASRVSRVPVLITSQRGSYDRTLGRFKRWFDHVTNACSDQVTTNAESIRRYQVDLLGLAPERVETIPNGLDLDAFPVPTVDGAPWRSAAAGRFPLVTIGRLDPFKGYSYLFEALALVARRHPGVSLRIAGEGPLRDDLEAEARARGLHGTVTFLGYEPDIQTLLASSYAFILPSLAEGMPNVVLESMAMERAVVASAVDGVCELVVPGETGLLVPPKDPVALARAIETLVESPELARSMGAAGRRRIAEHFDIRATVDRMDALYRRLSGERGLGRRAGAPAGARS